MVRKFRSINLEIWGGIECTLNRVNDFYLDQLKFAGHYERNKDISLFADLGIKSLRYPILWESHQPSPGGRIDWSWIENQLQKIRSFNITPIAGLVHHGSGPSFTDLNSESFITGLASYASTVAKKFPWIEYYTPVNEPLTTARFSGLYGFWYPHLSDDFSFANMLLNQMKGVVLSMKAIRKINPDAKLIQTEDLGKTYSPGFLKYQADFENERRWLTFDLLCGKVTPEHALWDYFASIGIPEKSLYFFHENPCPPDIIGLNYYITSERFLDDDLESYPSCLHGGNWIERYVDVEAVRINHDQPSGLRVLLKEGWERFELPMAITEVHLHCTREEQLRWFKETWETCLSLQNEGLDIRAITAWSLLGAYGWNRLLTCNNVDYEPGVFDMRGNYPRKTALAKLVKSLSERKPFDHPVLKEKGWWKREDRFFKREGNKERRNFYSRDTSSQPVLIIGKRGTLGKAFARVCETRAITYRLLNRQELDISNENHIEEAINLYRPWAIVNAAGFVRVDDAEIEIEKCYSDNTEGPQHLARACNKHGIKLLTYSSDLVFDGEKMQPYIETDQVRPLNIYGKSKAKSEQLVMQADPDALIIRTSAFFSPWDQYNFVSHVLQSLSMNRHFTSANDVLISPTYVPDLVSCSLDLLIDDEKQVWHLANEGKTTWSDLAIEVAQRSGYDTKLLNAQPLHVLNLRAARPQYSVLKSEKGIFLPTLDSALCRYFDEKKRQRVRELV